MEPGKKADAGKLEWHLLSRKLLRGVVRVLMFGKKKYGENNWQQLENARVRYSDALERHWDAWSSGEKTDPETGESHLDHLMCCILFLKHGEENQKK